MGACSTRIFESRNAARLINIGAGRAPRVDVRYGVGAVLARIQIGIENAGAAAELELEAAAFANLERRATEVADKFLRSEACNPPDAPIDRNRLRHLLYRLLFRPRGAAGKKEGGGEDDAAHGPTMPAARAGGKVAARSMRG